MWKCLIGLAPLACGVGCTPAECELPHVVISSAGTEPGTLRVGATFEVAFPAFAPSSDGGVVCLTCMAGFARLDRDLEMKYEAGSAQYHVAMGPDDTIYTIVSPENQTYAMAAFESTGALRWRSPPSGVPARLVAVAGGVYADFSLPSVVGQIEFFDAAHGERTAFPGQRLLAADNDGLFTVATSMYATDQPATVRRLDPTGAVTWERTWATPTAGMGVALETAVAAPDGGMIVVGSANDTVDFGDRMLPLSPGLTSGFLVALDASGAVRWAYRLPSIPTTWLAALPSGDVLLAGDFLAKDDLHDAMLAVATPTGIVRTHLIGGPADQEIVDLAASPDGLAWVLVSNNVEGDGDGDTAIMDISGHEFRQSGIYLFSIVP